MRFLLFRQIMISHNLVGRWIMHGKLSWSRPIRRSCSKWNSYRTSPWTKSSDWLRSLEASVFMHFLLLQRYASWLGLLKTWHISFDLVFRGEADILPIYFLGLEEICDPSIREAIEKTWRFLILSFHLHLLVSKQTVFKRIFCSNLTQKRPTLLANPSHDTLIFGHFP